VSQRPPPVSQQMAPPPVSQRPPPVSQQMPVGPHSEMGMANPPMSLHPPPSQASYANNPINYEPAGYNQGPVSSSSDFFDRLHQPAARPEPQQQAPQYDQYDAEVPEDDEGDEELFEDHDTHSAAETLARQIRPYSAARSRAKADPDSVKSLSGIEAFLRRKTELGRATALNEDAPEERYGEEMAAEMSESGLAGGPEDSLRRAADMGDRKMVEELLQQDVDPNAQGTQGETALMYAARANDAAIVQVLLRNGADPSICDHKGGTAMRQALRGRSHVALSILLKNGVDIDQRDSGGRTMLMLAAAEGDNDAIRLLLSMGVATEKRCMGFTALIIAVREGQLECVRTLLNEGKTQIDKAGPKGVTALMYASSLGHHHVVRLLLENGADPNTMDNLGYRAADYAKGKWPDVTAVFSDYGYHGPCSWMMKQWALSACLCCFNSKTAESFPEANDHASVYKDEDEDLPAHIAPPRMGPVSKERPRRRQPSQGSMGSVGITPHTPKNKYGDTADAGSDGEMEDEGTPLVDRYPNPAAGTGDSEPGSARRSSLGDPLPLPEGYEASLPNDDNLPVKLAMKLPDIGGITSPIPTEKKRRPSVDMSDDVRAALEDDPDEYLPQRGPATAMGSTNR